MSEEGVARSAPELECLMSKSRNPAESAATTTKPPVCDLIQLQVNAAPFPHVLHERFIQPEFYAELRGSFPECPPGTSPTGFSLYWGDEDYRALLERHAAWRNLFHTLHSQQFIDWCRAQFAGVWQREGCLLDLSNARYVPYREDRIDKERAQLRKVEHAPDELWVRMDIHQGRVGYDRRIHLDHARRLLSMLIYMCDHTESRMSGGELLLHDPAAQQQQQAQLAPTRITPRHNLMVAFPCGLRSLHSVPKITRAAAPRNYVQVHISSSVDIWPREANAARWRRPLGFIKRHLTSGHSN